MTTDELAAIVAAATERAGWQLSKAQGVAPAVLDENLHLVACEIGRDNAEWTANAPRTIIALVERIRELEAQRDAWKERFSDSDILPLKTLSECTGVSVYALRAACYRGAIQYWKINNNQHYASTIAEVRRYKRQHSPDQP